MIKVAGHNNLYRDPKSNAIVNTDTKGYQEYIRQRDLRLKEQNRIKDLENEVDELKKLVRDMMGR